MEDLEDPDHPESGASDFGASTSVAHVMKQPSFSSGSINGAKKQINQNHNRDEYEGDGLESVEDDDPPQILTQARMSEPGPSIGNINQHHKSSALQQSSKTLSTIRSASSSSSSLSSSPGGDSHARPNVPNIRNASGTEPPQINVSPPVSSRRNQKHEPSHVIDINDISTSPKPVEVVPEHEHEHEPGPESDPAPDQPSQPSLSPYPSPAIDSGQVLPKPKLLPKIGNTMNKLAKYARDPKSKIASSPSMSAVTVSVSEENISENNGQFLQPPVAQMRHPGHPGSSSSGVPRGYIATERIDSRGSSDRSWLRNRSSTMFKSRMLSMFRSGSNYVEAVPSMPDEYNPDGRSPALSAISTVPGRSNSGASGMGGVAGDGPQRKASKKQNNTMFSPSEDDIASHSRSIWEQFWAYTLTYPDSPRLYRWDIYTAFLVIYTILLIPYVVSFNIELTGGWYVFDIFVDCCFMVNILVTFRTVYIDQYVPIVDSKKIAWRYVKGWFFIDLLAAIPFSAFSNRKTLNHLLRLPRVMRVARVMRVTNTNVWASTSNMFTVLKLFIQFCIIAHWLGCGWYLVGRIQGFPTNAFSPGLDVIQKSSLERYIRSLSWGFTNLSGLGSNLTPQTLPECLLTMTVVIIALFVFAAIIGSMNSAIANLNRTQSQFKDRIQGVNEYMKYRRLPENTRSKIRQYYERIWYLNQGLDERTIISDLPRDLRTEVATFVHKHLLQKVPLFRDAEDAFIRALALRITPELCLPGDYIFRQGERGAEMYFLARGKVEIIAGDGVTVLTTLGEGAYFGEIAILTNTTRTASVRATDACELFVLQKSDFDALLEQYPQMSKKIHEVANERERNKVALNATKMAVNVISTLKESQNKQPPPKPAESLLNPPGEKSNDNEQPAAKADEDANASGTQVQSK